MKGASNGKGDMGQLGPQVQNIDWYKACASELQSQHTEVCSGLQSISRFLIYG